MEFFIPNSLVSDFDAFLQTPICPSVGKIRNWFANPQIAETLKAEITYINFKSKITNSDNAVICRVSKSADLIKGDILYDSVKNLYYLVTWSVFEEVNCKHTQLQICNTSITIERYVPEVVDNNTGNVITAEKWSTIVSSMRGWISRTGYYDFEVKTNAPGIVPNNKMILTLQANPSTMAVKIKDEFDYHSNRYQIVDVEYSELNPDETTGLVVLYAERKPGG